MTDEEGLTTVEYAMLIALIVVASIVAWTTFGSIARTQVASASNSINALPPS
jgi:Flp pilus assembly pilin Flp